tara:strand:+ start:4961 stop:5884 length:924 start_codon:yes stop_codon:yes gene_type:complete
LDDSLRNDLYRKLYLIRAAEDLIIKHYAEDEMKTPMHMSRGGEAIAVGVISALKECDHVTCTYRGHAVYLTKTNDVFGFFKEMYGKKGGTSDGKAGSMHLLSLDDGLLCSTAIVGTNISVGVGIAYANKLKKNNKVTAIFFGDGAIDEGSFWENWNFACLHKLHIIFVYEDNGYAVHSPKAERQAYNILEVLRPYGCRIESISPAIDVEKIYNFTEYTVLQKISMPTFLHCEYCRYLEHVGVYSDIDADYRDKREWYDPVAVMKDRMSGLNAPVIEAEVDSLLQDAISQAQAAPFPSLKALHENVYA